MYSRGVFVRSGEGKSCLEKWRGEKRIEREEKSGRSSLAMARLPLFSNRFRGYAAHARRVTASKLASGTVNGTTTPTATTLDVRGKEDEQREVSLAARAYDHCRPPVSRRSPRAGGTVVRIANLVLRYYTHRSPSFDTSVERLQNYFSFVSYILLAMKIVR